jgi:AraC-like DNA-binding protein
MESQFENSIQTYIPKSLFGIVDVIVQFKSDEAQSFKVLPNGKIELQFILEGTEGFQNRLDESHNRHSTFVDLFSATNLPHFPTFRKLNMILVILSPIAAKLIFGIPANSIKNSRIVPDRLKNELNQIQDRLNSLNSFQEKAKFLEVLFLKKVQESPEAYMMNRLLQDIHVMQNAKQTWWKTTRLNLDHINFSKSHFHRLCNDWLGMPYKTHLQLQQFRQAAFAIGDQKTLTHVALEYNYYDQAHFNRKFQQFANMNPNAYKNAIKVDHGETLLLTN